MWHLFPTRISLIGSGGVRGQRPLRKHFRPCLEGLEDRLAPAATITVNSALDTNVRDEVLTLREAILISNLTLDVAALTDAEQGRVSGTPTDTDRDTIAFDIPGPGVHTIAAQSALPVVRDPVVIDGYTQPGARPNTLADGTNAVLLVELNGSAAGDLTNGLNVFTSNSRIRGLVINRFFNAVRFTGSGNALEGSFLGTDAAGMVALGNRGSGVHIVDAAPSNRVGTDGDGVDDAAERNLLSGNADTGVFIQGAGAAGNVVAGNLIGTDATGGAALGNREQGIRINSGASGNTVGGLVPAARNVISGNILQGVFLGGSAAGNRVVGNYIGITADGTAALGNTHGVTIASGASQNVIGGTTAAARNVISGGRIHGVTVVRNTDAEVVGNAVLGNYIGTDASGTQALGNTLHGVNVDNARDTVVGGAEAGAGNVIGGNQSAGVGVSGPSAAGTLVLGNIIGTDETGTIPLGNSGPGVMLSNTAAIDVNLNVIAFNGSHGISLLSASGNTVWFNQVFANTGAGILLENADQNVVQLNQVAFSGGHGINLLNAAANAVQGNEVFGNGGDGISLARAGSNTIQQNVSVGNGRDGIHLDALSADNTLELNAMFGNGGYDCQDESEGTGTAGTANVWIKNIGLTEGRPGLCELLGGGG